MALSVNTVWEINNSTGVTTSNGAGGGFNPSNANFATDLAGTSANTASPIVSSGTYTFVSGDVGHRVYIQSGTNWVQGWYVIASVSGGSATLSAAIGAVSMTDSTQGSPAPRYITNTVAGCATTASPTAGVFSVDYSQVTTVPFTATDLALVTNTTITSVTVPFGANHVGNIIHIVAPSTGFTQGWYEIVSVLAGTATIDRAAGTAPLASGAFTIGGTISLNSVATNQTDSSFFNLGIGTNGSGGMRFFWKFGTGTYVNGTAVLIASGGGTQAPVVIEGYNTTRGDSPTGTARPTFNQGANSFTLGGGWDLYNVILIGSGTGILTMGANDMVTNVKATCISNTASRVLYQDSGNAQLFNCEGICYKGRTFSNNAGTQPMTISGCYFHDCDTGILATGSLTVTNTLFANCFSNGAIVSTTAVRIIIQGCTFYGAESKLGTAIDFLTGTNNVSVTNTIIYGWVLGTAHTDVQTVGFDDYNDYFNNTTDVTRWQKGVHDLAINPSFASVAQIQGTTGSIATANKLVDTTKNFASLGVIGGTNVVTVISGTGATAGMYQIDSISTTTNPNDTLNITIPANIGTNATGNVVYQITTGLNFGVGTVMKATGFPGAFGSGTTTGFLDMGAVQRQEPSGGGGASSFTFS